MGWIWRDDEDDDESSINSRNPQFHNPNPNSITESSDNCSIRKTVESKCNTVEIEPGKFVRKCEKTEQILRDCVGKPTEIVQSNKEYTEDDVTNEMKKGLSSPGSSDKHPFDFPGLRNDIEAIERNLFGGLNRFFDAADDIRNGIFRLFDDPSLFDKDSSRFSRRQGVPIEDPLQEDPNSGSTNSGSGSVDLSGLVRDV